MKRRKYEHIEVLKGLKNKTTVLDRMLEKSKGRNVTNPSDIKEEKQEKDEKKNL